MCVYILYDTCSMYSKVVGVYSTEEKAKNALEAFKKRNQNFDCYPYISKRKVDREDSSENGL